MSLAQAYVSALKLWSGITDARWDWMINPYYDVWFTAQSLAPERFVMDIRSVQQIQPNWLRWIDDCLSALVVATIRSALPTGMLKWHWQTHP